MKLSILLPKTLTGRLILLSISYLFALQLIVISAFVIDMNNERINNIIKFSFIKTISIVRLLDNADPRLYDDILKANKSNLTIFLTDSPIIPTERNISFEKRAKKELGSEYREIFIMTTEFNDVIDDFLFPQDNIITAQSSIEQNHNKDFSRDFTNLTRAQFVKSGEIKYLLAKEINKQIKHNRRIFKRKNNKDFTPENFNPAFFGSIKLNNGQYLAFGSLYRTGYLPPISTNIWYVIIGSTFIGTLLFYLLITGITAPLKKLTTQTNILSHNYKAKGLPIEGPKEIRELMNSFNRMQESLASFISDRTRILASISHDLKTPLTSMMLRAQFLPDSEDKTKLINTIETMTRMVKATLEFARSEETNTEQTKVHLDSLIDSICSDYQDAGKDVDFHIATQLTKASKFLCNTLDMHRILQNLIDNALSYGNKADVYLSEVNSKITIEIVDNGPGIPEEKFEEVFYPFSRLDKARNTSEAHVGLGLSIVRNTILKQGGKIILQNVTPTGLKVTITYEV